MHVFVTGATGYVGSAVVPELLAAGHSVVGLARSDSAAATLAAGGAAAYRGDLGDLAGLRAAAAAADAVVHTGYRHDAPPADAARTDLAAVHALVAALEGSDRPLVVTSATGVLVPGRLGTEADPADPTAPGGHRSAPEQAALGAAGRGVRSSVVRLAPSVHGPDDRHGFVPGLLAIARTTGLSGFVDDGVNRWPAVHRRDAARLFRLAVEGAPAGSVLHGVGEEGVPFRSIAEAIGRRLGLPAESVGRAEATDHFGWLARFAANDNPSSSARTQQLLGWRPEGPGLLTDLDAGLYG